MDFGYFYGKQSGRYAFYRIPKQLFTECRFDALSIGAKLRYGMMVEVKDRFHCANDKAVKLMWELDSDKGNGFLEF